MSLSFGPWSLEELAPGDWPSHYADDLDAKSWLPPETFLALDPLVSLSTAIAARSWVWSLTFAAAILLVCMIVPRGFCAYVCPLGTMIDLADWGVGRRLKRFQVVRDGWWVNLKYFALAAVLTASLVGVLLSGFVAAIPVVTRGLAFLATPIQTGFARGWHQVPPVGAGQIASLALFAAILGLGVLRPRFWCRYLCPTGALFSLGNFFRIQERRVGNACSECNRCRKVCPFDAIEPDFSTRTADCTFCQTCGGACPAGAITFVGRWHRENAGSAKEGRPLARRRFLSTAAGFTAAAVSGFGLARTIRGRAGKSPDASAVVRPPGSVPEAQFLELCIRCGECYQACPNDVLQPMDLEAGLERLWTPQVVADWSGCEPSCNNCGHVCPTGAIRALALAEKRAARMGLAVVDLQACLPYAGREACPLCLDECLAAGYNAIELIRFGTQADEAGMPIEGTGLLAPVVLAERCVGCGLCQTRCRAINVVQKRLLERSAIRVEAGEGKEDRLTEGSYLALRRAEKRRRDEGQRERRGGDGSYLPESMR
jgi:MauM/NapG family ferredoxin protein